jgi:putative transposase
MCEVPDPVPLPKTGRIVGIDMGINALITTSAGEQVHNPHWYRQAQAALRRKQRKLQPAQKGSHQPQKKLVDLQRQHEHVKNQRKDFFDKLVYRLVQTYDVIVIEDLKIKNMVKKPPPEQAHFGCRLGNLQATAIRQSGGCWSGSVACRPCLHLTILLELWCHF